MPDSGDAAGRAGRAYVEPWYFAYALLGVTVVGGIPILLPLKATLGGSAGHVGLVMAMFNLGSIAAPFCGSLADRYRVHRALLAVGFAVTGTAVAALAQASRVGTLAWFSLLAGLGAAAATTVPYLLVVEAHPKPEWAPRIGWLQLLYGAGQVVGLALAGIMSRPNLRGGLALDGALTAAAAIPAWLWTRTPARPAGVSGDGSALGTLGAHVEHGPASMHRHFHLRTLRAFRDLGAALGSSFGVFLLSWTLVFAGSGAYFTVYPVLMARLFHVDPATSSLAYAAAVAVSLLLYQPAGAWTARRSPDPMVRLGFAVRLLCLVLLSLLAVSRLSARGLLSEMVFGLFVLAWALLSVSGAALAARRSPIGEGGGMGLFNAVSAAAGVSGAAIGGWAASAWGYGAVPLVGTVCVACGMLVNAGREAVPALLRRRGTA